MSDSASYKNEQKERFEALEARVDKIELVVAKTLQLVKNQNEVVQKLTDAVAAILKKLTEDNK